MELRNFLIEDAIRNWLCRLDVSWLDWPYYVRYLKRVTQTPAAASLIEYPDGTRELIEAQFELLEE
jgi:hypothetical protein